MDIPVIYAAGGALAVVTVAYLVYWVARAVVASRTADREETLPPKHGKDRRVPGGE